MYKKIFRDYEKRLRNGAYANLDRHDMESILNYMKDYFSEREEEMTFDEADYCLGVIRLFENYIAGLG